MITIGTYYGQDVIGFLSNDKLIDCFKIVDDIVGIDKEGNPTIHPMLKPLRSTAFLYDLHDSRIKFDLELSKLENIKTLTEHSLTLHENLVEYFEHSYNQITERKIVSTQGKSKLIL